MSAVFFPDDVQFLQRVLCAAGCYDGPDNGVWNARVDAGENRLMEITDRIAVAFGTFDQRSEANIRTLHPRAQQVARQFLSRVRDTGVDARIISGTRTYAEQERLYRIGRFGSTERVVTKARGGQSNHNFGIAWDIGIFRNGKYLTGEAPYRAVAKFCLPEMEWGGRWASFPDLPHYQLAVGKSLAEVRACFESRTPFVPGWQIEPLSA